MSTEAAIAGVTSVLQQVLNDRVGAVVNGAIVTARPLDKAQPTEGKSVLNLFLYQAVTNAAFSNLPMPGTHPGIDDHAPIALNLHYLLTVFGKDDTDEAPVEGQLLLGAALSALLDRASLKRSDIRKFAAGSDLEKQVDLIRLTTRPMTLDDVSKLWTAFQAPYRLSTAIEASCVLIETRPPKPTPLPVVRRGSDDRGPVAMAAMLPFLERLTFGPRARPFPAALVGEAIHADGKDLVASPPLSVVLRTESADGATTIDIPLKVDVAGGLEGVLDPNEDWRAGPYLASVTHLDAGRVVARSPETWFAIAPRISGISARVPGQRLGNGAPVRIAANASQSVVLEISVAPQVWPGQSVEAEWHGQRLERVDAPAPTPEDSVAFRVQRPADTAVGLATPPSVLRLRVAKADSLPFAIVDDDPRKGFEIDPGQQVQIRWQ